MRVLFDHAASPALAARLASLAADGIDVAIAPNADFATLAVADAIWHVLSPVTAAAIAAAPRLRLIQKIGSGVNTIDLAAAAARGIAVCNLPGTNSRAVAEHTLLLILATLRRLPQLHTALRDGTWSPAPALADRFGELGGRVVGLVGYGAVPRILAPILAAMGCDIVYAARREHEGVPWGRCTIDALLAQSDIVSLHLPLGPETARLIDAGALARMKHGAILINTARGGLVDQAALLAALQSGHLAAAGLDVFEQEPVAADERLLALPNVVVTPHVAWLTPETWRRSLDIAAENIRRLAANETLLHRVA